MDLGFAQAVSLENIPQCPPNLDWCLTCFLEKFDGCSLLHLFGFGCEGQEEQEEEYKPRHFCMWNLNFAQVDAVAKEINLTQLEVWQDRDLHVTSALPMLGHEEQGLGSKMTP